MALLSLVMLLLYLLLCSGTYLWAYVFGSGYYYLSRPFGFWMPGAFLKFSVGGVGYKVSDPNLNDGFFYFFAERGDESLFYFFVDLQAVPHASSRRDVWDPSLGLFNTSISYPETLADVARFQL